MNMTVAVFDIDNTLVKGSTTFPAAIALARAGLIEHRGIMTALYQQVRFRLTSTEPELAQIRSRALAAIRDVSVAKIDEVLEEVADRLVRNSMIPGSLKLLRAHQEKGDDVWLATAGPGRLAEKIASRLGVTGALGSEVEVADGRCTGALAGPFLHGPAKAEAVAQLAKRLAWDMSAITAYSDSIRDLPMLRLAADPKVVNPDPKLRLLANTYGWSIFDTAPRNGLERLTMVGSTIAAAASVFGRNRSN
jgi:HAD superfamily hydrolase (TIGR01490 family)